MCDLIPGGANQTVAPDNVYLYVKLYAELRMVGVCQEALLVSLTTPPLSKATPPPLP